MGPTLRKLHASRFSLGPFKMSQVRHSKFNCLGRPRSPSPFSLHVFIFCRSQLLSLQEKDQITTKRSFKLHTRCHLSYLKHHSLLSLKNTCFQNSASPSPTNTGTVPTGENIGEKKVNRYEESFFGPTQPSTQGNCARRKAEGSDDSVLPRLALRLEEKGRQEPTLALWPCVRLPVGDLAPPAMWVLI